MNDAEEWLTRRIVQACLIFAGFYVAHIIIRFLLAVTNEVPQ